MTITGAGVVGLAVGYCLAQDNRNVVIIERNASFGQETSSRNSEVIHAGIYYPKDSLKAKTCIEGKGLIYEYCAKNSIAHRKTGKLIVAIDKSETQALAGLFNHALACQVEGLRFLSREEIKQFEPHTHAEAAIYSPSTGIIDSHHLMKDLSWKIAENKGQIAYNTELAGIDKTGEGFVISVKDKSGECFKFSSRVFINCAGLDSYKVACMAGIKEEAYRLKYCKGDYFRVSPVKAKFVNGLVYPVPKERRAGLGIHATVDLSGSLRLGPDDNYVDELDYRVDTRKAKEFYESVRRYLPFIQEQDLSPDTSGIRPKLQGPGETFRDFVIKEEGPRGMAGFINLIGIESPGLTACLALGRMVKDMAAKLF